MKRLFIYMLMFIVAEAQAVAVPAYSGKINNAVGSIIQAKTVKQGFAANDPRFGATVSAAGTAATTVAVGLATGAVATVGWPALLIGAGISALVTGAVALGVDGLVSWLWPDQTHTGQTQLAITGSAAIVDLSQYPPIPSSTITILNTYGTGADVWYRHSNYPTTNQAFHFRTVNVKCPGSGVFCGSGMSLSMNALSYDMTSTTITGTQKWTPGYSVQTGSDSSTKTYSVIYQETDLINGSWISTGAMPVAYTPKWQNWAQTALDIPASYATQPLSDQQLAAIANAVWKNAASANNSQAIPWSASDPITPADISTWRQANPSLVPTVSDFVSPVAAPGTSVVPITNPLTDAPPVTVPGTTPSTTPSTTTATVEWGDLVTPTLEATPTTESILDPLFNMWPQWNNFAFPSHASECPRPTFVAMNHTFTFDQLCTWVEMIREPLQASFALMWAFIVIVIVMGA
jgi:hypothetical protein